MKKEIEFYDNFRGLKCCKRIYIERINKGFQKIDAIKRKLRYSLSQKQINTIDELARESDLSYSEIGIRLGLPESQVWQNAHKKLKINRSKTKGKDLTDFLEKNNVTYKEYINHFSTSCYPRWFLYKKYKQHNPDMFPDRIRTIIRKIIETNPEYLSKQKKIVKSLGISHVVEGRFDLIDKFLELYPSLEKKRKRAFACATEILIHYKKYGKL